MPIKGVPMRFGLFGEDSDDDTVPINNRVPGRFGLFDEDSDDDLDSSIGMLMMSSGPDAALLSEMSCDRQLLMQAEIRRLKLELEMKIRGLTEKDAERNGESERMSNLQSTKRIAEALDAYLIAVRRDFELKFQIEERQTRDDAENLLQEKMESEAQAEIAEKLLQETMESEAQAEIAEKLLQEMIKSEAEKKQCASETALDWERRRMEVYEELCAKNTAALNLDCAALTMEIKRSIRTMQGLEDNVQKRAEYLVNLINHSGFPQSIGIAMFVDTIVAQCDKPTKNRHLYAYAQAAVLVSSTLPQVMDMLVAKLNKVCIYTVPKHIPHSAFETNEAYFRAIGYRQENGKNESTDTFLEFMASCMKLYGAIVQTEVRGFQNPHGVEHGWAWLARFLNALPPNLYTAVALSSFMKMAGYEMHRRFGHQFVKVVGLCRDFLEGLPEGVKATTQVYEFLEYLESSQFLEEPEERVLQGELGSSFVTFS